MRIPENIISKHSEEEFDKIPSKEELYHDIDKPVSLSVNYILMVILSSFVAGIVILKNNVAIIIGVLVISIITIMLLRKFG